MPRPMRRHCPHCGARARVLLSRQRTVAGFDGHYRCLECPGCRFRWTTLEVPTAALLEARP